MDNNERMLSLMADLIMRRTGSDEPLARRLANGCTSYWLKDAIRSGLERDPVDALNDAATLVEIMQAVCDEVIAS